MENMCQKGKDWESHLRKKDGTAHTTAEEWAKASQKRRMAIYGVFNPPLSISVSRSNSTKVF
jgi:hypothetical protein